MWCQAHKNAVTDFILHRCTFVFYRYTLYRMYCPVNRYCGQAVFNNEIAFNSIRAQITFLISLAKNTS